MPFAYRHADPTGTCRRYLNMLLENITNPQVLTRQTLILNERFLLFLDRKREYYRIGSTQNYLSRVEIIFSIDISVDYLCRSNAAACKLATAAYEI